MLEVEPTGSLAVQPPEAPLQKHSLRGYTVDCAPVELPSAGRISFCRAIPCLKFQSFSVEVGRTTAACAGSTTHPTRNQSNHIDMQTHADSTLHSPVTLTSDLLTSRSMDAEVQP